LKTCSISFVQFNWRTQELYSPEAYGAKIREAVDIIYNEVPLVFLNLVAMFDVTPLSNYSRTIICDRLQTWENILFAIVSLYFKNRMVFLLFAKDIEIKFWSCFKLDTRNFEFILKVFLFSIFKVDLVHW